MKRATINISVEAKSTLDSVKSLGQSYDGIIREVVKFWRKRKKP
jgi:predicted CopG family antitoxin